MNCTKFDSGILHLSFHNIQILSSLINLLLIKNTYSPTGFEFLFIELEHQRAWRSHSQLKGHKEMEVWKLSFKEHGI